MKTVSQLLDEIRLKSYREFGADSYIYGECLRDILSGKTPEKITVFIRSKNACDVDFSEFHNDNVSIKIGKSVSEMKSSFTINNGYWRLQDMHEKNSDAIVPVSTVKDVNKKAIKFTREAKEKISDNPYIMLEALILSQKTDFFLDSQTLDFIFHNKRYLNTLSKRTIQNFFRGVVKTEKSRKIVSNLNALGVSKDLFGKNLVETSFLNHLKEKDFYEFLYLVFNNIESDELEEFLEKLLSIATDKIIQEPDFNSQHKILAYLNKERGSLWQEGKAASN
jgi:tRNA nucleotidyltransferase/poly(A) polymerase